MRNTLTEGEKKALLERQAVDRQRSSERGYRLDVELDGGFRQRVPMVSSHNELDFELDSELGVEFNVWYIKLDFRLDARLNIELDHELDVGARFWA